MRPKQTKIVATISDLKCDAEFIRELHDSGVDVVRLNTAHQSQEDTLKVICNVREVSTRIALLLDTKGPEIRTTKVEETIEVKKGDIFKIKGGVKTDISTKELVYVTYKQFVNEINVGDKVMIDDGELGLEAIKKQDDYLVCEVKNSGVVKSNKSVNVPGVNLHLPSLSEKDKEYIQFAIENDIDFIAHSFVRNKEDIIAIQKMLDKHQSQIKIIAKIESQEGVDNIDEILDHAYGIMVARGDLGIEIPIEKIPLTQKMLIQKCIARHKPVITATQMLHTMIKNPRPTRAEVSDVANAVLDGTDAIMLSGETAYGEYPLEAVKMMSKIVRDVESQTVFQGLCECDCHVTKGAAEYLAETAVQAAHDLAVKEIIISSEDGASPALLASYRGRVPVFAKCSDERTVRELSLTYGINAHCVKILENHSKFIHQILETLVEKGKLHKKDTIIYLSGDHSQGNTSNSMEICEVGKYVE